MKTTIQNLPNSQTELKIEVPTEEFKGFIEKAVLDLGKDIEVEGFRKGKAPKEVIEKKVGQEKILQAAAQDCIKENYIKAIKEQKLEPLGQPEIEILKIALGNSFEFKAKISILSEIKLSDYKKIASQVKKREVKVTDEEITKLKQEKERIEKERLRSEILEKIAEKSQIDIPQILIENEQKRMLENIKQQVPQMLQVPFEEYLKKIQKTEKDLLDSFLEEAKKRVKNSLVLREIERKEDIKVSEKELEAEIQKVSQINPALDKNQLKEYSESVLKNEKILQLLENL
ncbi:Trigger factor [subsurface metagenome]